ERATEDDESLLERLALRVLHDAFDDRRRRRLGLGALRRASRLSADKKRKNEEHASSLQFSVPTLPRGGVSQSHGTRRSDTSDAPEARTVVAFGSCRLVAQDRPSIESPSEPARRGGSSSSGRRRAAKRRSTDLATRY